MLLCIKSGPHAIHPVSRALQLVFSYYPLQFVEQYTSAGLRFYVNPVTKETRWSPPRRRDNGRQRAVNGNNGTGPRVTSSGGGGRIAIAPAPMEDSTFGSTSRGGGGGAMLPHGWEQRTTVTGRPYYLNHDLRYARTSRRLGAIYSIIVCRFEGFRING